MAKKLIVGENSFIAQSLKNHTNFFTVSYKDYHNIDLEEYDVVVNCALNPEFKTQEYERKNDVDFEIAKWANENKCHYVMLSTRKVYGSSTNLKEYFESDPLNPYDFYSENKVISEANILSYFGETSSVIRGSNLYGYEQGRNSFMGYFINSLDRTGNVVYTVATNTQKDIIYVPDACKVIASMCHRKVPGIFNLGDGKGTTVGDVGRWLIWGYGLGDIKVKSDQIGEQFILNSDLIYKTLDIPRPTIPHKTIISNIGSYYARFDYKRSIRV